MPDIQTETFPRRREMPVGGLAVAVSAMVAVGGWVWFLSAQASQVVAVSQRVTIIEQRDIARDERVADMADRLARMEPMLQFLVRDAQATPHPVAR